MTDAELFELEEAARKATQGPWLKEEFASHKGRYAIYPAPNGNAITFADGADAEYIACANPAKILDLINMIRKFNYPECPDSSQCQGKG